MGSQGPGGTEGSKEPGGIVGTAGTAGSADSQESIDSQAEPEVVEEAKTPSTKEDKAQKQAPPVMSPTDIFSLGVVLHELCTLKMAFDYQDLQKAKDAVCNWPVDPLPENYSQPFRKLIMDMLRKDPEKRPTARQILDLDFVQRADGGLVQESTHAILLKLNTNSSRQLDNILETDEGTTVERAAKFIVDNFSKKPDAEPSYPCSAGGDNTVSFE